MNPYLSASGILLNDCLFTEPVELSGWRPPQYAGLFAVFVHDTSCGSEAVAATVLR